MSSANLSRVISFLPLCLALGFTGACSETLADLKVKDVDSVVHYPATGGVIISASRDPGSKAICVAPPAQGAVNVDLSVKHDGKVNVLKYVEVETQNAVNLTKTLAKLYEQNERTLFLQFSLYRLCEAYANGMLDEETYAEAMARESLALKRAAAEADVRLSQATAIEVQASAAKSLILATYEAGLKKLPEAEGRLETLKAGTAPPKVSTTGNTGKVQDGSRQGTIEAAEKAVEDAKKYLASEDWKNVKKTIQAAEDAAKGLLVAKAEAEASKASADYATKLAGDALVQESAILTDAKDRKLDVHSARKQLSRRNYERLFERVLSTAETLAKQQVEIARAEAEKAKIEAEAEKAKAEAEKAKTSDETKKIAAKLEELQGDLVKAAIHRVSGCGDKCDPSTQDKPAGAPK